VQLRNLENQQTRLLAGSWSTNAFVSALVTNVPLGFASATVFANGISSTSSVVLVSAPSPGVVDEQLTNGSVHLSFNGLPGLSYTVLGPTNLAQPLANWPSAGGAVDTLATPGQHQFTDLQSTNLSQRFYKVRWP